jgi:molybdenum-dependent DNA-binding transcriptional regulator ModE
MIPQKTNKNTIHDLVESEWDESPVADMKRMLIRMFNELKEDIQKQFNEHQENMDLKTQEDTETTK